MANPWDPPEPAKTGREATVAATVTATDPLTILADGSDTPVEALSYANAGSFWVGRRVSVDINNPADPIVTGGL